MQCFKLPADLCEDIHKACAAFWWGDTEDKRRLHWVKWNEMCRPKAMGGLGFRDLHKFNKALLAKQLWRLVTKPQSLVARIFRGRYHEGKEVLEGSANAKCSFTWRSIIGCRDLVERGARRTVGNGSSISIFKDRWVLGLAEGKVIGRADRQPHLNRVCELITPAGAWDELAMKNHFLSFEADAILNTPIGEGGQYDGWKWGFDARGEFSVRSAYQCQLQKPDPEAMSSAGLTKWWEDLVWAGDILPKAKIFLWRAFKNIIPSMGNLRERHVPVDGICKLCKDRWASTEHCLIFCPKVIATWKVSSFWRVLKHGEAATLRTVAEKIRKEYGAEGYDRWCLMVWKKWLFRCKVEQGEAERLDDPTEEECEITRAGFLRARSCLKGMGDLGVQLGARKWCRPGRGSFRVDVDAAHDTGPNGHGVGVIIRDSEGQIIAARARRLHRDLHHF